MVNESSAPAGPGEAGIERLFGSVVAFSRRLHATGQRWAVSGDDQEGSLTRSEAGVLRVVAEGECRPGAVAARLCVGPAVVSRQLAHLSRTGMVERRPDPADGRAELLSLTPGGRQALRDLRAIHLDRLGARLADWDEERLAAAAQLVDQLAEALAPLPGEPGGPATHHTTTHDTTTKDSA